MKAAVLLLSLATIAQKVDAAAARAGFAGEIAVARRGHIVVPAATGSPTETAGGG